MTEKKAIRAERAGPPSKQRYVNFVIRRECTRIRKASRFRSSFNAKKLKYQRPSELAVYEIRIALKTRPTNYEKGAN
jgi:hypothetical protein